MSEQTVFGKLEQRDDIWILPISGRLSAGNYEGELREKVQEIKDLDCDKLVADVRALDYVDSYGLSFFIELYRSVAKHPGGRFALAGPSKRIREVIEATRLMTILNLTDDLDSALAHCAHAGATARQGSSFVRQKRTP